MGGFRHGWGKIVFKDGASYEGEWVLGHAEGNGTFHHMAGEVYRGGFMHNLKHGIGITMHLNKKQDEGQWFLGEQTGVGVEHWPDGG